MQTSIPYLMRGENRQITSTGNHLLDKKIADGIPLQSLTLIEGENDTGKSVPTRQIMEGVMKQGLSVDLVMTGNATRSLARQMDSMSPDVSEYFAWGYLRLFPLHVVGFEWTKEEIKDILRRLSAGTKHSTAQVAIL
jgi:flagellar protein FlaH